MAQMQTVSIRLPDEDFQWLLSLEESHARTPSEKLRALLQRLRREESERHDPESLTSQLHQQLKPLTAALAGIEQREQMHSELLDNLAEHLPRLLATMIASPPPTNGTAASELENLLALRCFRLFGAILRGAVTSQPASFAPDIYARHLPDIIELATLISSRKTQETHHG